MSGRIIPHRLPSCPGQDSRYTLRHNPEQPGGPWWVYYQPPGGNPIPADDAHLVLVELVNALKAGMGQGTGGSFSINEHAQVIARMAAPPGQGNSMHVVNISGGAVDVYNNPITFQNGQLSPASIHNEGERWSGPLCGISYSFVAPGNRKAPSRNLDEVFVEEEGQILQLSSHGKIDPYPPTAGPLLEFLQALRRQIPGGGRFRVNEHGRAFTSDTHIFIGTIPRATWFRPLTPRS